MIKIVTVYNSLNPGSLLQSIALYKTLEKKYDNVYFHKTNIRHPYLSGIKLCLKLLKKFKIKNAFKQLTMPIKYSRILKKYRINSKKRDDTIFILGSDEIWNVSRAKIAKHPIFWGIGLNQRNCISYAPSINNTTTEDIDKYPFIEKSLSELYAISVRDTYSKMILSKKTDRNIELVCDPTMLLDSEEYRRMQLNKNNDNYILVYGSPKRFSKDMIAEIKDFAKKQNKKIISYYFYHDWCDEILYGSPFEFLSLIANAEYIFTNTFHGTIFSIIYNKQFVAFGNNNKKVEEILKQFDLDKKCLYNKGGEIDKILSSDFKYDIINKKISEIRKTSLDYLYGNIDNIYQNK